MTRHPPRRYRPRSRALTPPDRDTVQRPRRRRRGPRAARSTGTVARIAVVAVGYADGFPRAASATDATPGADAIVAGTRCPVAGRVSMDLMAIDVTALPEHTVRRGDTVTMVGGEIGVDDLAAAAGTIGYEVLVNLGKRYHRIYRQA